MSVVTSPRPFFHADAPDKVRFELTASPLIASPTKLTWLDFTTAQAGSSTRKEAPPGKLPWGRAPVMRYRASSPNAKSGLEAFPNAWPVALREVRTSLVESTLLAILAVFATPVADLCCTNSEPAEAGPVPQDQDGNHVRVSRGATGP